MPSSSRANFGLSAIRQLGRHPRGSASVGRVVVECQLPFAFSDRDALLGDSDVRLADVVAQAAPAEPRCGNCRCAGADERIEYEVAFLAGERDAPAREGERKFRAVTVFAGRGR
jgi:hypothetical protein